MRVPRDLSGAQLIKVLCRDWGYRQAHQEGSHVILQTETPGHQRLSVPNHNPLRVGNAQRHRASGGGAQRGGSPGGVELTAVTSRDIPPPRPTRRPSPTSWMS